MLVDCIEKWTSRIQRKTPHPFHWWPSQFAIIALVILRLAILKIRGHPEWIGGANSSASSGLGEFVCGVLRTQIVIRKI
jgi:hypothetical protein